MRSSAIVTTQYKHKFSTRYRNTVTVQRLLYNISLLCRIIIHTNDEHNLYVCIILLRPQSSRRRVRYVNAEQQKNENVSTRLQPVHTANKSKPFCKHYDIALSSCVLYATAAITTTKIIHSRLVFCAKNRLNAIRNDFSPLVTHASSSFLLSLQHNTYKIRHGKFVDEMSTAIPQTRTIQRTIIIGSILRRGVPRNSRVVDTFYFFRRVLNIMQKVQYSSPHVK